MKVLLFNLARVKCNRCGVIKFENAVRKLDFDMKPKQFEKKKLQERDGDWNCSRCKNLNFSFRVICNRCNSSKTENIIENMV
jgi:hypothetical protein